MKTINKDIINAGIDGDVPAIMHQCNCQSVMGSGLAKQIKVRMPEAYNAYMDSNQVLGEYSNAESKGCMVFNLYGQYRYGKDKRHTNYAALFVSIMRVIHNNNYDRYGIPYMIGCGLGGGNWIYVQEMLMDIEELTGVEFVIFKP